MPSTHPLVRIARAFLRQRARGIDPRPPPSGVLKNRFGEVTFGISGEHRPSPEISVSGASVSVVHFDGSPDTYKAILSGITVPVAKAVLTELVKVLPRTTSRQKWLDSQPELDMSGWSSAEKKAATVLHALATYSEEQRTHAQKQIRGGLREIIGGTTAFKVFGGTKPLVRQAHKINTLRSEVTSLRKQFEDDPDAVEDEDDSFPDISESSDLEDEAQGRLQADLSDDLAVMRRFENGIAPPSLREHDAMTRYVRRGHGRVKGKGKAKAKGKGKQKETAARTVKVGMNRKRRRDDTDDPPEARPAKRARSEPVQLRPRPAAAGPRVLGKRTRESDYLLDETPKTKRPRRSERLLDNLRRQ